MNPPTGEPRRASAALVLGVLSGALAALTVLPTIVPMTYRVVGSAEASEFQRVRSAAVALASLVEANVQPPAGLPSQLAIDGAQIRDADGHTTYHAGDLPSTVDLFPLCSEGPAAHRFRDATDISWVIACEEYDAQTIITARRPDLASAAYVAYLVMGLAAMVGISTALGVLQILSPISELSRATERMGTGERGVRLSTTGFAELDELIESINAAYQAQEDRELAITSRFEVVQEMARLVAHEIRNPLQSLELLTSLIASESDLEERRELAESIHGEIRILESVVQRLLKDSEGHLALRPNRTPTKLSELIGKVITFRKFEARRAGIRLESSDVSDVVLSIDKTLISRAIENLIINAMQAVPQQGGRIRVTAFENESHVCIVVDDNGPGVDPELGDSIYHVNVSGREEGTGLGLALVQGVLQAHNGYVEHRPSPMGGARFRAWIPVDPEAVEEEARAYPGSG